MQPKPHPGSGPVPRSSKSAFVVCGTHSGCGKTTVTLGLMAALTRRGRRVQPFKVGPDFIDPGLHTLITGRPSHNLDGWMLSRTYNEERFRKSMIEADAAVVEGVMGVYDGHDGVSEAGSTAEMAKWLNLPLVLVVDARSMARSVAALVQGFTRFDPALRWAGVIFNRIGGPGHLAYLEEAMAANLPELPVLGGLPRKTELELAERHLGLVTAEETTLNDAGKEALARWIENAVDVDGLLQAAALPNGETERRAPFSEPAPFPRASVPVAVARDAAYCFYYPDNLDMLEEAGAEILPFSPVAGETFPKRAAALILGGGYPELHAEAISRNRAFLEDVRSAHRRGMPIYAECGGLMTLGRFIETGSGKRFPMAGILPFGTRMLERRKALGYVEVELVRPCCLGPPGTVLRGHEFHYSEIVLEDEAEAPSSEDPADPCEKRIACAYRLRTRKLAPERREGYLAGSCLASYVHLHWGSAPEAPRHLMRQAQKYRTDTP